MPQLLSLPHEIISEIVSLLSHKDLRLFSLLSSVTRQFALPPLFCKVYLRDRGSIKELCDEIHGAGNHIKHAIKNIVVEMALVFKDGSFVLDGAPPVPLYIFHLLQTLPKLSSLIFEDLTARVQFQDLHWFARIAQKTALRHLTFSLKYGSVAKGLLVAGPEGLESISVKWNCGSCRDDPGNSFSHLYEFLRPSLATLVHLELQDYPTISNFEVFAPACTSLRTLKYKTYSRSAKVLEPVADMFPNITNLEIVLQGSIWTNEFLERLPSFHDLTHLTLSLDFELAVGDELDEDHDFAWYRRCFFRRFNAAREIAKVCPRLQRCGWLQLGIDSEGNDQEHDFVILEEAENRVVMPVMQWWMAKCYEERHGGPLPDDMVRENAYWE